MNINDLATQLLYTTVPVWIEYQDGTQGSGTSTIFIHNDAQNNQVVPLLLTNAHLLKNTKTKSAAKRLLLGFARAKDGLPIRDQGIRVETPPTFLETNANEELDLAAGPLGPILNELQSTGQEVFFRSIDDSIMPEREAIEELSAVEDVSFVGYPSGVMDAHNFAPVFRRGITSTPVWNNFGGKPEFLIDAGVFPGSSGSPVFLFNQGSYTTSKAMIMGSRLVFLGLLTGTLMRNEESRVYLGLGRVVNALTVHDYLRGVLQKLGVHP